MSKTNWAAIVLAASCLAPWIRPASAQKLEATVLYRQNSNSDYKALIPGYTNPASPDCAADLGNAECYDQSLATETPSTENPISFKVVGTTLSLRLPDGRVAVVNCVNKLSSRENYIRRGCGMPLVEHVEAEFKGKNAHLEWPIGPDGRKMVSEKYRIVAVLAQR